MNWAAKQYVMFEEERTRPVRDLLFALPAIAARSVIDIGCGPGNSTELLALRFPSATIRGVDSSLDMIEAARKRMPKVNFDLIDIATWQDPGPFDVILANAVLQWLPNHSVLLPTILSKLNAGGCFAFQIPDNLEEPAHRLMREIAMDSRWATKLVSALQTRAPRHHAEWYFDQLHAHCSKLDIWCTTYYHVLAGGAPAIVEWFKGSGLRPFLTALSDDEQVAYLDRYTRALADVYPTLPDGKVLLPFPRLFVVATR